MEQVSGPWGYSPGVSVTQIKDCVVGLGMKLAVFFHAMIFFLPSLYACGGVCSSSQAPALLPCFVKHSLEQLALAFARVGSRSLFILVSL